jgi:two-component system chemotaxis response regulator CheB
MKQRDIIVIGGSAGSLGVLKKLVGELPAHFPAAIFVVWHMASDSPGTLADVLDRNSKLPAKNAVNDEKIVNGHIYVAPPDHHLLIHDSRVRLSRGPKENRFRPAVDPLFRSAARWSGSRAVGVVLSGGLDDGTSGLWAIKEAGGATIVQDPYDAEAPSMPSNALARVAVDHCVPAIELADLLVRLVNEQAQDVVEAEMEENKRTEIESDIAEGDGTSQKDFLELGEPSLFACPECHGVLLKITEGNNIRFRCHTGHGYSSGTLLAEITEAVEESLWNAARALDESFMLLDHFSEHLKDKDRELSKLYEEKARRLEQRSLKVRELAIENGQIAETNRE